MKKLIFILTIVLSVGVCYAQETLTTQQKEAQKWFEKGITCVRQGQGQKAIADYTKAIELDPQFAAAYYYRGVAYNSLDQYQKAIADYTKAIELDPQFAAAYYYRGVAYVNLDFPITQTRSSDLSDYGKFYQQKAIDDYTKAIELDPQFAAAYYNRGWIYKAGGFPTLACDDFYQEGLLHLKQKDKTMALKCVDSMKKVDPYSPLIKKFMDQIYAEPQMKK